MTPRLPDRDPETADSGRLPPWPFVLGLSGGVASGKSSVGRILAAAGYEILDADREAKRVLRSPEIRPWLLETFGSEVEDASGELVSKIIAERVFRDPDALKALEAQIHPPVRERLTKAREEALREGRSVVLDVPLLFESAYDEVCDLVLFVDVPDDVRRSRAIARGMDEDDWERREAAQMPLDEKRRRADRLIPNGGDLAVTRKALADLCAMAERERGGS